MFGGDDDDDFAPANNSKLASLFSAKSGGEGNTSLTYTAPKQPKNFGTGHQENRSSNTQTNSSNVSNRPTSQPSASNKLGIIVVKAVNTYKLEDGTYNLQGKLGAAVLGNSAMCVYQLLLYKGKQHHVTSTKITPKFQFTVQPNNYGTFYDDQKQNWSLHFEQDDDVEEFAKEIGLARGSSQGGNGGIHNLLTQDLSTGEGPPANVGDSMEIFYSVYLFTDSKLGQLVENNLQAEKPQRVKIRKNVWEEGLIGATKGSKRIILLPPNLVGPWKQEVPPDTSVVVEVQVSRLKQGRGSQEDTPNVLSSLADSGESAVDSSTDDTGIKARGVSISEALTASPKTHKANIISRMARMGQATLPLKGAVTCNPSDTEDSEEEARSCTKPPTVFKPAPKVRATKTPPPPASENRSSGSNNVTMPPQQMAVYQSVPAWQQQSQAYMVGQYGISQLDGQLYPLVPNQNISSHHLLSTGPAATPTGMPSSPDSHLSVFLSETRTHNTEVRIGMAKVADKVDLVLAKLDASVHTLRPTMSSALLDSASLLASIQRLVSDNEQLKTELANKGNKIDMQNDRIYQLLNVNHKYVDSSDHEAMVAGLRLDKARLAEELARLKCCEREAGEREATRRRELAQSESLVAEQDARLRTLAGELDAARVAKEAEEVTVTALKRSLVEMQEVNQGLQASLSDVTRRLTLRTLEADKEIEKLNARLEASQARETSFKSNAEAEQKPSERLGNKQVVDEVKRVMNVVYKSLHREFINGETYLGENIKETLAVTIRDVTCQLIEKETCVVPASVKSQMACSSAHLAQREKSQPAIGIREISKENLPVSLESCSGTVESSSHYENDFEGKSVSAGYSGMLKDLSGVASEPISKPAVTLPSTQDTVRTSTNGINKIQRETSIIPSEHRLHTVEDLNPSADGPKDVDASTSDITASCYAGGNAGDIPTVPLAKLPGETDLSLNLVYTDSDIMQESFNNLRVTSDLCVSGTAPTLKVLDDNTRELKSAVISESKTRPAMEPTTNQPPPTTGAFKSDGQQQSTNKEEEIATENLRESSLERKPWRSEPPPLFDEDEDEDDWLS